MKTTYLCACLLLGPVAATPSAQAHVWVVSNHGLPGKDFSKISDAITAAADGDVILVDSPPGSGYTYVEDLVIQGKALTIQTRTGASAKLDGSLRVSGLSAVQSVIVRGLSVQPEMLTASDGPLVHLRDNAGAVWLECDFFGAGSLSPSLPGQIAALVEKCESVVFAGTLVGGRGFPDSTFGSGDGPYTLGGVALQASHSTIYFFDGLVLGGDGGVYWDYLFGPGTPMVFHHGPPATGVWLESSDVFFNGTKIGPGFGISNCPLVTAPACGVGLYLGAGSPNVTLFDTPVLGSPPRYVQTGSVQSLLGESRSIGATSPAREGEVGTLTFTGLPGDLALIGVSPEPGQLASPLWTGTALLGTPMALFVLGQVPAFGEFSVPVPVPELGVGVEFQRWLLQGAAIDATGDVVLTEPTAVVLLDAGF